jgi:hypothetical protein
MRNSSTWIKNIGTKDRDSLGKKEKEKIYNN